MRRVEKRAQQLRPVQVRAKFALVATKFLCKADGTFLSEFRSMCVGQ